MFSTAWSVALAVALQAAPVPPDPVPVAWPDDKPFTRIIQNLGRDVAALPSLETLLVLTVGGAGSAGAHRQDDETRAWVLRQGPATYTTAGRRLGDGWTQGGTAVAAYVVGRLARSAPLTHVGSDLVRAQVLNGLVTTGLKHAAGRERPNGGNTRSFPSGHSSASFTTAAVLHGHFGWKAAIPGYALASFIAWTRVRDDVHWASDVAAGATIGVIVGRTVTRGHRPRAWQVVAARPNGGLAVYVVRSKD